MYLVNSPFWLQWLYPTLTWHKNRKEKHVYLTFDDGPIPVVTPFVLNTLKNFNACATFFCIGENVYKHPEIYKDLLSNGHAVGNHTQNHLKGWKTPDSEYLLNIEKCTSLVNSNLFRPPYGRIRYSQIRKINLRFPKMRTIMWDVLSGDFDTNISGEKCVKNVLDHVKNGSIIVFHDSEKAFSRLEYALPVVLKTLRSEGYEFRLL
ncbi:polysaccharide deacetylase family protein [Daejeonella lutea]|uniref:Peptidoglycan/xylan/chitin deacetylase, PgdA/CDA1 family n=1 Tax=Daejeonella lutea TaxID=572036 RepID=A0A1T5C1T2_9SPHI|nr:polysaccharide deacetylase family protein [Daejeonella lutea]SKB53249.1 Peptidoglycan/xylan/chitin deacetylase, PgdA/CDA1 family [Daejeonella lutea]